MATDGSDRGICREIVDRHQQWMRRALQQARQAAAAGEVPVGAVLVRDDLLVAEACNMPISSNDPSGHAEIRALRLAGAALGNYRLCNTTMYVTLEPCPMCSGALVHARVSRVVYGAKDPKTGALDSLYRIGRDGLANHSLEVVGGILEEECALLLRAFFRARRGK